MIRPRLRLRFGILVLILVLLENGVFVPWIWGQETGASQQDAILHTLNDRVHNHPEDGAAWRLLGKAMIDQGMFSEAEPILERAVALRPLSVAAWFDLGTVKQALDKKTEARKAYETVLDLAPEGVYTDTAQAELQKLAPVDDAVVLAEFEVRQFDAKEYLDRLEDRPPQPPRVRSDDLKGRIEMGLLYNSNVALAPVSRQLAPGDRSSAQFFVAPDLEWTLRDETTWRTGPTLRGHFTKNEEEFDNFNLQSYRPGWFGEWYYFSGDRIFVPRLDYELTHDEFAGSTLGNRHAVLSSLATYWSDHQSTNVFYSLDYTNFTRDGILPRITSQDGWTHVIGASHDVTMPYRHLRLVRAGLDLTRANTRGSDYRFNGLSVFTEGIVPLVPTLELTLGGGWGYRDYFDFEFSPSRDEFLWNANAELRKYFSETLSAALVMNYDHFDSDNPLFAAERFLTGCLVEWNF